MRNNLKLELNLDTSQGGISYDQNLYCERSDENNNSNINANNFDRHSYFQYDDRSENNEMTKVNNHKDLETPMWKEFHFDYK